tara:strand:+ start:5201 stop:6274 length:1074 start_codon:yes stop_codon:yes gene_type:complete
MNKKIITYTDAINLALHEVMSNNNKSVCIGLGINDPKRIFGTTKGLLEKYGERRVIEPPTSENALTGIAFGMSLQGYSVCLTHQRFDFALLSFDQIINSIAKWSFMFDKDFNSSILIRLIIGRGWGQGPTHSQSFHSFLSSIPGINVFYPVSPISAYETVKYSMSCGIPAFMIEHRWLHQNEDYYNNLFNSKEISYSNLSVLKVLNNGDHLTIFTYGYMVPEALKAVNFCKKFSINIDLIIIESLNNLDLEILLKSIAKTKKIILIEPFYLNCSITTDICTTIFKKVIEMNLNIKAIKTISLPFENESSSYFDTKKRYSNWIDIIKEISSILDKQIPVEYTNDSNHDVPGDWFKGPF